MKDRTKEFTALIDSQLINAHSQLYSPKSVASTSSALPFQDVHYTEFTQRASLLQKNLRSLKIKLETLELQIKTTNFIDERPIEIENLTYLITQDLHNLNQNVSEFKVWHDKTSNHDNHDLFNHTLRVVKYLQTNTATCATELDRLLKVRAQKVKETKERREKFSATSFISNTDFPLGTRLRKTPPSSPSSHPIKSDHLAIEISQSSQLLQQQQQEHESDSLLTSGRNTAIQGIEMAIQEIGTIYQQLAHMVSEQGEMVQRIDMNMEEMQLNVQRGQEQLLRYLRSISGNRGLIIKLFIVAMVFIIVYAVFLT